MANYNNDMERMIVESVLAELRKNGAAPAAEAPSASGTAAPAVASSAVVEDGVIELPDISMPMVDNPHNRASLEAMKKSNQCPHCFGALRRSSENRSFDSVLS